MDFSTQAYGLVTTGGSGGFQTPPSKAVSRNDRNSVLQRSPGVSKNAIFSSPEASQKLPDQADSQMMMGSELKLGLTGLGCGDGAPRANSNLAFAAIQGLQGDISKCMLQSPPRKSPLQNKAYDQGSKQHFFCPVHSLDPQEGKANHLEP